MINSSNIFRNSFVVLVSAILLFFLLTSFFKHDPHWLNRGGALIAAFSAAAIFFQIKFEIRLENERQQLKEPLHDTSAPFSPVERVTDQLKKNTIDRKDWTLTKERLHVVAVIAICAFVGELLHGFGDFVLILFFAEFFAH